MRINREIRADRVRVVSEDGEQLGVMNVREALRKAEDMGLDLVEIAPTANPPVCKIINYGKLRYLQTKKEKENKKTQHQIKIKEIKLKPNIDVHDLEVKIKHAREFLQNGNKVRLVCMFKGREMLHMDIGEKVLQDVCKALEDISGVEAPQKNIGRIMTLVLFPQAKKKEGVKSHAEDENQKIG